MTSRDVRLSWGVFALLLFSFAYFYQGGGWNENSRFDLVQSIVDDHTIAIDRYHENTGDKASYGGHFYSDKAPGLSLLAVPIFVVLRLFRGLIGNEHDFVVLASYITTVLTVGVAGAGAGALVYRAGRKLGATPAGAVIASVGYGLGTIAFPFSTMLFGHQLAAFLLFVGFVLAWDVKEAPVRWKSICVPLVLGAAVLVEMPTAPAAMGLLLYHLGFKPTRRSLLIAALAALPVVGLALYLLAAFDSPLRVGYDVLADPASRDEMHTHGVFGLTYPHIGVLAELLMGRFRGLLPYSPVLLLAIPGFLVALSREVTTDGAPEPVRNERRRAAKVALGVSAYFLLFVSSYTWWQGGSSFGSRHLIPMLPFFATPIALVASRRPVLGLVFLVPSIAVMLVVTSVQPKVNDRLQNPFWAGLLPAFGRGVIAANDVCPVIGRVGHVPHEPFLRGARYDAFNVGMAFGSRGPRSLAPLFAVWLTSAWALGRAARRESDDAVPENGRGARLKTS
ncbi:MAG TPA: hypothetical protein VH062_05175 [Polyangiaceae bacterium]|nr:hypothetical protein [Polyangiaceae bacterium]